MQGTQVLCPNVLISILSSNSDLDTIMYDCKIHYILYEFTIHTIALFSDSKFAVVISNKRGDNLSINSAI